MSRVVADQFGWLEETLALAVPLEIYRLGRLPEGHRQAVIAAMADRAGRQVGHYGDALMWPSPGRRPRACAGVTVEGRPGTAGVFAALAGGLAAAAFQPGGVTWRGRHWCVDHARCEAARP